MESMFPVSIRLLLVLLFCPLFTWWTILGRNKDGGPGVRPPGLSGRLTPYQLCDLGQVTSPGCASVWHLLHGDNKRTFLQGLF